MKIDLYLAAGALGLAVAISAPAGAQMSMPGMTMPMPAKAESKRKQTARKVTRKAPSATNGAKAQSAPPAQSKPATKPAPAMGMPMDHGAMPTEPASAVPTDHSRMGRMAMPGMEHGEHAAMAMNGALGPYPMQREGSGTAWQPDNSGHTGLMSVGGGWTLMAHGIVNLVYDHQSGPRGDDKVFANGMLMGMAARPVGNGTLLFRASFSPDPLMGPSGYPLLLASGETANGRDRLIDRQHPHDLFMELSASVSQDIGRKSSIFLYGGLPGEPAFGPPAFMHREAILDSPEAPISHHWLDSTHISFGVVTAGLVVDRIKLEVSRFNAREPDQHRWNIETGPMDSTAVRLSWNPTPELALQGSWGHFVDPEQLEPGVNQKRWSASLLYSREVAKGWKFAGTLAWGRKTVGNYNDDAFVIETSAKHAEWTIFGRGEMTENRELMPLDEGGPAYRVGKISLGMVRDFRIADHLSIGAGGLFAINFVPDALAPFYGSNNPTGTMAFVRLKLD